MTDQARTRRLTTLELDDERVSADLSASMRFSYNDSYADFTCGVLRSTMLWNQSGELEQAFLQDYDGAARTTPHGQELPYVNELIRRLFKVEYLKFARLMRLTPGSVYVPHRDYLELDSDLVRVHLPLQTDDQVFTSEDSTVYQMRRGEVWFLDATRTHSVASFSAADRVHIICDFVADSLEQVLAFEPEAERTIPASNLVARPPLRPSAREALMHLAEVLDPHNYRDVLTLLIKQHFVADISGDEVFLLLKEIAAASGRPELLARVAEQEEFCMVRR